VPRDRGTLGQFGCPIAAIRALLVDCTRIFDEIVIDPFESLSEVPSPTRDSNKKIQADQEQIDEYRIASVFQISAVLNASTNGVSEMRCRRSTDVRLCPPRMTQPSANQPKNPYIASRLPTR